jgi:hypothetical protein
LLIRLSPQVFLLLADNLIAMIVAHLTCHISADCAVTRIIWYWRSVNSSSKACCPHLYFIIVVFVCVTSQDFENSNQHAFIHTLHFFWNKLCFKILK